jgi:DNA-binding NtrC family response regulator
LAANVSETLRLISSNVYDVLLSDLHIPGAGDRLTVVSAMRHANLKAVTISLSAFPEMDAASHAIFLQADQILVKSMGVPALSGPATYLKCFVILCIVFALSSLLAVKS